MVEREGGREIKADKVQEKRKEGIERVKKRREEMMTGRKGGKGMRLESKKVRAESRML